MTATELLHDQILPQLNWLSALKELRPEDKGDYLLCDCPQCKQHDAFVYKNTGRIICNRRESCGFKSSLWDYTKSSRNLNTNRAVLEELARLAGVDLGDQANQSDQLNRFQQRARIRESVLGICRDLLFKPEGQHALDYLMKGRGYSLDDTQKMEIGYYSSVQQIRGLLQQIGISDKLLDEPFLSDKFNERIVGLWSDSYGNALGFWGRCIGEPPAGVSKYYYERDLEKNSPFGLFEALPAIRKEGGRVIVVESPFTVLVLRARGILNAVAAGGSTLSDEQLQTLHKHKVKHLLLDFDQDNAGFDGTESAIQKVVRWSV